MATLTKRVWLIYSESERDSADQITRYLIGIGCTEIARSEKGLIEFTGGGRIVSDTAVVLLSDSATQDAAWQRHVRTLPADFRVIPIGGTVQADYKNPSVVPPCVMEINYIQPVGGYLDDLSDALFTDPVFYPVRNEVMLMVSAWQNSKRSDSFLMRGFAKTNAYLKLFQGVYAREKNPSIREKGEEAIRYLKLSRRNALLFFLKDLRFCVKYGIIILTGIALLLAFFHVKNLLNRAACSNILLSVDMTEEDSVTSAIKIAEGLTNPFAATSTVSRDRYYSCLSELLEKNWPNSPLGIGLYKWALNDVAVSADPRYLYTANGNGQVVTWDSYTGEIVKREAVSANPLAAMSAAGNGLLATIDSSGQIYLSEKPGSWKNTLYRIDIRWTDALRMQFSDDAGTLLVFDDQVCFCLERTDGALRQRWAVSFDEIADAGIAKTGNAYLLAKRGETWNAVEITAEGRERAWPVSAELSAAQPADVQGARMAFADASGQVLIWDRSRPDAPQASGLVLTCPICLSLSEADYLVFHDRNAGSQVYDFKLKTVLSDCLPHAYGVSRLELSDNLIMAFSASMIYSEDLTPVLPLNAIPAPVLQTYSSPSDISESGIVKSISIENDYLIRLVQSIGGKERTLILDCTNRFFTGDAQRDDRLMNGLPENWYYYTDLPVYFVGVPTAVGILPGGNAVVIGAYDGSFYEICFSEAGTAQVVSHTQVPTHSPIKTIFRLADRYCLEDAAGCLWRKRMGSTASGAPSDIADLVVEIREKIHSSVSDPLVRQISPQLSRALNLHRFSIPAGKEWE